jgi:dihydrolipoamide dehydrogenase
VEHIRGWARFKDDHTLEVESDGNSQEVKFENAIIATGSRPAHIPGIDLEDEKLMYSEQALELKDIPGNLLVIGAGYIGLEMATIYAGLGSSVSLAEMTPDYMPGADRDLVKVFAKANEGLFNETYFETKVTDITSSGEKLEVTLENKDGKSEKKTYDKVLVAIGRKPGTENLNLDKTDLETDKKGFLQVDIQRRTQKRHIFAIGDVAGEPMLAHKATHEGKIAAEVIAGHPAAYEPAAIPAVIFTSPEIAWCGLTETEAREQDRKVKVVKFPWAASGRAATLGESAGLTKLIIDAHSERVLGVGIAGAHAGDLIPEGVLAVEMAAQVRDLSLSIHPHPTLSETIMEAAESVYGTATHFYRKKK